MMSSPSSPLRAFIQKLLQERGPCCITDDNHMMTSGNHSIPKYPISDRLNCSDSCAELLENRSLGAGLRLGSENDSSETFRLENSKERWDSAPTPEARSSSNAGSSLACPRRSPERMESPRRLPEHTDSFQIARKRRHSLSIMPTSLFDLLSETEQSIDEEASISQEDDFSESKVAVRFFEDIGAKHAEGPDPAAASIGVRRTVSLPCDASKPSRNKSTKSSLVVGKDLQSLLSPRLNDNDRKSPVKLTRSRTVGGGRAAHRERKRTSRKESTTTTYQRSDSRPIIPGRTTVNETLCCPKGPPSCPQRRASVEFIPLLDQHTSAKYPSRKTYPSVQNLDHDEQSGASVLSRRQGNDVRFDVLQSLAIQASESFPGQEEEATSQQDDFEDRILDSPELPRYSRKW